MQTKICLYENSGQQMIIESMDKKKKIQQYSVYVNIPSVLCNDSRCVFQGTASCYHVIISNSWLITRVPIWDGCKETGDSLVYLE